MSQSNLHAEAFQARLCRLREILREWSENPRRHVEQNDSRCFRIDAPELRLERVADQHGDRAGHFHSGWASADKHECQEIAVTAGVFLGFGLFERLQDLIADRDSVGQAFQTRRKLLEFVVAESNCE